MQPTCRGGKDGSSKCREACSHKCNKGFKPCKESLRGVLLWRGTVTSCCCVLTRERRERSGMPPCAQKTDPSMMAESGMTSKTELMSCEVEEAGGMGSVEEAGAWAQLFDDGE